jgi:cobalt/nickel transport protein
MSQNISAKNRMFLITSFGVALAVGVLLSPFASQDPDGLDRVSQDHKFEEKAQEPVAQKLPFYAVFEEYALRGVPEGIATPMAGLVGTLATFGVAWGVGKLMVRKSSHNAAADSLEQP